MDDLMTLDPVKRLAPFDALELNANIENLASQAMATGVGRDS